MSHTFLLHSNMHKLLHLNVHQSLCSMMDVQSLTQEDCLHNHQLNGEQSFSMLPRNMRLRLRRVQLLWTFE